MSREVAGLESSSAHQAGNTPKLDALTEDKSFRGMR